MGARPYRAEPLGVRVARRARPALRRPRRERERTAGTGLSRWDRERAPLGSIRPRSPEVPSMTTVSATAAAHAAAPFSATPANTAPAAGIAEAARLLLPDLERGRRIDAATLRAAMERAFGGSDAEGAWDWKTAYDACEAATVLFLRKFGPAMRARAASPAAMLPMLAKIAGLLPTHTRRSEESQALQQFSTPIALGLAASAAAAITLGRPRAGAFGRDRPARHSRRARRRRARAQRTRGNPRGAPRPSLSGRHGHPVRRGADR